MGTDVTGRVSTRPEHSVEHRLLHRGHIGDDGPGPPLERRDNDVRGHVRWRRDDDDVRLVLGVELRGELTGAEVSGEPAGCRRRVLQ